MRRKRHSIAGVARLRRAALRSCFVWRNSDPPQRSFRGRYDARNGKVLKETGAMFRRRLTALITQPAKAASACFTTPRNARQVCDVVRQPVGLCGLITPWNFPMAIHRGSYSGTRLRNTVVIKPAEDTPLSTYNLVKACEEAGIPRRS